MNRANRYEDFQPLRSLAAVALYAIFYLGLAGFWSGLELAVAIACAAATEFLVQSIRLRAKRRYRLHPDWLGLTGRILRHIGRDCLVVSRALLTAIVRRRHVEGVFREIRWEPHEDPKEAASLRALVTLGLSLAPNSFVVDVDEDSRRLILHHLVPPPPEREGDEVYLP